LNAFREIWRDHWGYVELPFEEHYERFLHTWRNDFKEGLWLVALVEGTIAGLALCETRPDQDMGYVAVLGVRREYRQRGIAMALLKQAFFQFYQLGFQRVTLHVDASNLTGALRLYERAGMYLKTRYDLYEKELRAGVETRTEAVQTAG
jgi:ribosomal protein S18 acetylase RimI-like enzyme